VRAMRMKSARSSELISPHASDSSVDRTSISLSLSLCVCVCFSICVHLSEWKNLVCSDMRLLTGSHPDEATDHALAVSPSFGSNLRNNRHSAFMQC
jgi:hypothetical protein